MFALDSVWAYAVLFFYHFTMDTVCGLALTLTLNGYDIKKNRWRILIVSVALGAVDVATFGLSHPLRVMSWLAATFIAIKTGFRFSTGRTVQVLFTCMLVVTVPWVACFILHYGFNVTFDDYLASLPLRLLFPLSYNIPVAMLAYLSYRRQWRIFRESDDVKIPWKIALGPAVQVVLMGIILNEFLFCSEQFGPGGWVTEVILLPFLSIPWFLSLFFLWQIFRVAEQEAEITAQEKSAAEMRRQTDAIRAQRHDFINHVQVMIALLKDGRKKELEQYAAGIKKNLPAGPTTQ
ncbi:MAG: hypothetical protein AB1507_04955 [Bacillota bacterium]